ncbi:hypothetical protein CKA32_005616 [Geitlerinema sp. FC II]|nr:hypothetical protein CKA32_005616 [Geitlerinema sp. FC II]
MTSLFDGSRLWIEFLRIAISASSNSQVNKNKSRVDRTTRFAAEGD